VADKAWLKMMVNFNNDISDAIDPVALARSPKA
jgi:hypothetical protein